MKRPEANENEETPAPSRLRALRWSPWVPRLLAGLMLLLSVSIFYVLRHLTIEQQRTRFYREVAAHTSLLRQRFDDFEQVLQATRAFWLNTQGPPQAKRFYQFTEQLGLSQRFPEVQALGFLAWLPKCDAAAINNLRRTFAQPRLQVSPRRGQETCVPVAMISPPNEANLAVLGYNAYYERNRRDSIDIMRSSNFMQATRPINLAQYNAGEHAHAQGFLVMLPVWRNAQGEIGIAGQDRLDGFVYLAVRVSDLLMLTEETIRGQRAYQEGAAAQDIAGIVSRVSMAGECLTEHQLGATAFEYVERLKLAGQEWNINYKAEPSYGTDRLSNLPSLFLLAGLFLSFLAHQMLSAQIRARHHAEKAHLLLLSARRSEERAHAEFEAIFQSMQDGAVFTDLDGNIQMVNRAFARQFGVSEEQLRGKPLQDFHQHDQVPSTAFHAVTSALRRADGQDFYGEIQRAVVSDNSNGEIGQLEVIRDVSERVKVEKALRTAEQRLRASLDAIPHIVWVSDEKGNMLDFNALYSDRLGQAAMRECVHTDDLASYDHMWERVYGLQAQGECTVRLRVNAQSTDQRASPVRLGRDRWFDVKVAPLLSEDGSPSQWVASATDIHDRLVAERMTQRSEERYRGVLESVPQIVWLTDAHGNPSYVNKRWSEYVGPERASHTLLEAMHPADRLEFQQIWETALRRQLPFEAEHRVLGSDGLYRTFVTRGLAVRDSQGQVLEWVGTCTDIDDSVYSENASRLLADIAEVLVTDPMQSVRYLMSFEEGRWHSERYSAALQLVGDRIFQAAAIWTTDRILTHLLQIEPSAALSEKLPQDRENIVRLGVSQFTANWHDEGVNEFVTQLVEQVLSSRKMVSGTPEMMAMHPILRGLQIGAARMTPLFDSGGNLLAVLGISHKYPFLERDHELIDELAKKFATSLEGDGLRIRAEVAQRNMALMNASLEDEVNKRTAELQEMNNELEAFSYSISHDLRTPLRHITSFSELLIADKESELSEKAARFLNVINDSALRLSRQVDSLLDFSRNSRKPLQKRTVNLGKLVNKVWKLLEPDRQERDIYFHCDPLPDVPADPALLELAFQNLLSNAIKYTGRTENPQIHVQVTQNADWVAVAIADNGVGFDPHYTAKLFGVFQRLHDAKEFEGIGVGLANVRRIIARHGGSISAQGELGKGATFTITLPIHDETIQEGKQNS